MDSSSLPLQVGVKALLKNNEEKYLLVRRNPKKYPEVGPKWDIPGGRIEVGSTLIENLKREVKEETGLDLKQEPKLAAAQDMLRVPGKHIVRLTFVGEIEGQPQLSDRDHTEVKWFSPEEIKSMGSELDPFFKEFLDKKIIEL